MSHLWFVVRWLHILAMAFFLGGQLFLAAIVVPVERRSPDRERLRAIARRFGYGTLVALGVLIATGGAMASHLGLWGDETFQSQARLGRVDRPARPMAHAPPPTTRSGGRDLRVLARGRMDRAVSRKRVQLSPVAYGGRAERRRTRDTQRPD